MSKKSTTKNTIIISLLTIYMLCGIVSPLQAQVPLKPSTCINLDFAKNDFSGWQGRTSIYPPNYPDASNCDQNSMVLVTCPSASGVSCNGCYSGSNLPGIGGPKGVPVPGSNPFCLNPPVNVTGQLYDNMGIFPGRHTIMTTSVPDPYACNNIFTLPTGDPACARLGNGGFNQAGTNPVNPNNPLGNTGVGWEIDYLSYTFKVDPSNTLLTYKYAVVLQDPLRDSVVPAHTPAIRPRFNVYVRDSTNHKLIDPVCGKFEVVYDTTISGFRTCPITSITALGGNPFSKVGTAYRAWTTVSVDLRKQLGNLVTISFNTWDCGWGAHFGYAYVTARCDSFAVTQKGCNPDGSVILTAPPGFSYSWLPNGQSTQSIKVYNSKPGDTVKVVLSTVNGCTTDLYTVIYPTTVTANMIAAPLSACIQGNKFAFIDSSYSIYSGNGSNVPIVSWNWTFGDGDTSSARFPMHSYKSPGTYTVTLKVTNIQGCMDSTDAIVIVHPPPVANFTTANVCLGNPVSFQDLSTSPAGIINSWTWSFGDGTPPLVSSTQINPSHTYTTIGTFTVNLKITSTVGCRHDTSFTVNIWAKPIANFVSDTVCVGNPITFIDRSLNGDPQDPITGWMWEFGDNSPFTGTQHPKHTYGAAGTYTVKLTVTSQKGCKDIIILPVVVYPLPKPDFTFTPICFGMTTSNFTDLSGPAGTITQWSWNFGDPNASSANNNSILKNPSHSYSSPGSYTVSLKVTSVQGCVDSVQKIISLVPSPLANFTTQDVCAGSASTFQDLSNTSGGVINQWSWSFGDGTTTTYTTTTNPVHTYTASGTYTVRLKVTSNTGCVDDTVITVKAWPKPNAIFTLDTVCFGDSTSFRDLSLPGDLADPLRAWIWVFGDGSPLSGSQHPNHMYHAPTTYTVRLIVTTQRGCVDDTTRKAWVYPLPSADFSATPLCFGLPVNFTDKSVPPALVSQWSWNFGDPVSGTNNTSGMQNPTHLYTNDTTYHVKLVISTPVGCKDSIIKPLVIPPPPVPDFDANKYEGCVPLDIKFYDLSYSPTDSVVKWDWTFGDGHTSTSKNPPHTYRDTGVFTVSLTITTVNGCKQSFTWFSMIRVYPWPVADFDFNPKNATETSPTITFKNMSKGEKTWVWDMGDESASTEYHPVHSYPKAGTYTVWLYVQNKWGCRDSIAKVIVITPEWSFYIPNAFSPNRDGKNESFIGKSWNVIEHQMWIFDRWGNMIYTTGQTKNPEESVPWNGKANDGERTAQEDVYVWVVQLKDIFGVRHKLIGHVTLVR